MIPPWAGLGLVVLAEAVRRGELLRRRRRRDVARVRLARRQFGQRVVDAADAGVVLPVAAAALGPDAARVAGLQAPRGGDLLPVQPEEPRQAVLDEGVRLEGRLALGLDEVPVVHEAAARLRRRGGEHAV